MMTLRPSNRLALPPEELVDNDSRNPRNRERGEGEQSDEEHLKCNKHAPSLVKDRVISGSQNSTVRNASTPAVHWIYQRTEDTMPSILLLASRPDAEVLPALGLLSHQVKTIPAEPAQLVTAPQTDIIMLDARQDLVGAKNLCKILQATGLSSPLVLVVTEGGLAAINSDWDVADVILNTAGPAEVDARIRLASGRLRADERVDSKIMAAGVVIDEASYQVKVNDRPLDLTFKEFELLRFLAQHPSRVFTREQLLSEVWGYDYFGGTRTVDVHVRRLRAKLGDMEGLIGTVRNVGYRFNVAEENSSVTAG